MKLKNVFIIATIFLPGLSYAQVTKKDLTQSEVTKYETNINASPALRDFSKGIEQQYNHRCETYTLETFNGDNSSEGTFTAKLVCIDKRKGMENSGKIITVDGDIVPGQPIGIYNIRIDNAG